MYKIIYIPVDGFSCKEVLAVDRAEAQEKWDAIAASGAEMRTDRPR